jgi:hypothetical protein
MHGTCIKIKNTVFIFGGEGRYDHEGYFQPSTEVFETLTGRTRSLKILGINIKSLK